jgi:hypothetical protein
MPASADQLSLKLTRTRAHGRERRRRAAAQEVERSDGGPPHRGVGQDIGVFGVEEFGVRGKLPKFQRYGLGVPLFLETRRGQRFDAADD